MIQIECNPEGGFSIVEGFEEFLEMMETKSMVEVRDASTGNRYFAHEVGEQVFLLDQHAQHALSRLADNLIQDIAAKPLH